MILSIPWCARETNFQNWFPLFSIDVIFAILLPNIFVLKSTSTKSSRMWFKLNITIECFQYLNWSSSSPFKYWNLIGKVQYSITRMIPLQVKTIKWNCFPWYPLPSIEFTFRVMYIFILYLMKRQTSQVQFFMSLHFAKIFGVFM